MKKIIIFSILMLFLINIVSAYKINDCIEIIKPCDNCTYARFVSYTLPSPNSKTIFVNGSMSALTSGLYNYTLCSPGAINKTGVFEYSLCGNPDGEALCNTYSYEISMTNSGLSIQQSLIFLGFLIMLFLFLIGGFYGMSKSMEGAWTIFYICISYLSMFSIFFISWLFSSNYLYDTPIIGSIFWILWLIMAYGFFPFIIIVSIYIIGKGVEDNLVKEYVSQGYTKEEASEMSKKKRR